jgi:hypothetical protein
MSILCVPFENNKPAMKRFGGKRVRDRTRGVLKALEEGFL